ncbi:NAD-dependent epimerase/dehydratase family protein [Nocardia sp. FBN12]|uniref:NAD-dependent epimerase/dehydratase family protein n=1 Tax=Nocardia sp. FBN12 TaxID=3419766 RepID=UPI003D06B132
MTVSVPVGPRGGAVGRVPVIAVLGATGMVGSATMRALSLRGLRHYGVARNRPISKNMTFYETADICDQDSLRGALSEADVIIHAASYTGRAPAESDAVNRIGAENVAAVAAQYGISRIIYVSTVGVYGIGPHRGVVENEVVPNPVTHVSKSRLAAEHIIRRAGGIVVRPGFVYGKGDRWFLPGVASILTRLGAWIDDGGSQISVISMDDLAGILCDLATIIEPVDDLYHACELDPVTMRNVGEVANRTYPFELPRSSIGFEEARRNCVNVGLSEREIDLVGLDHYYDASRIWAATRSSPSTHFDQLAKQDT